MWIYLGGTVWFFLFKNKTFLFSEIESWNFQYLFEIEFLETHKILAHSAYSDNCYFRFYHLFLHFYQLNSQYTQNYRRFPSQWSILSTKWSKNGLHLLICTYTKKKVDKKLINPTAVHCSDWQCFTSARSESNKSIKVLFPEPKPNWTELNM